MIGPTTIKNSYCYSCHRRGFRSGYCDKHERVIRENEILPCMFDDTDFIKEAPLKLGQVINPWDGFYDDYKDTVHETIAPLYDCTAFRDFLEKVDKRGQGTLIKELFGSDEAYIDSPGDFHRDPGQYEHSIIYNYIADCSEGNLLMLFGFWCNNLKKCYEWTYPERLRNPLKLRKGRIR